MRLIQARVDREWQALLERCAADAVAFESEEEAARRRCASGVCRGLSGCSRKVVIEAGQ